MAKAKSDQIKPATTETQQRNIAIKAPNFQRIAILITGTSPYVQNKFSAKAREQMKAKQAAGSTANKSRQREAKDFEQCYRDAMHVSHQGWHGIPAPAFRNAMISACRTVGFKMTLAKLSVFVEADGLDKDDGTPLVKITKGEPHYFESLVKNESGVADIRPRPMWDEGWQARVVVRFDADQFTVEDVVNLMLRVGQQVGIGEGRADSSNSAGMGWGEFTVETGAK